VNDKQLSEAEQLNLTIQENHPVLIDLLSEKGKSIYYPRRGLLQQGREAKGKKINATIGMAYEDDGSPIRLPSIDQYITLDPEEAYPYAPSFGLPSLREQWQGFIKQKNPSLNCPITMPVVTNGLTHALHIAGYLFVDPGDHIVVPAIMWGNYKLIFNLGFNGAFQTYPLFDGDAFNINGLHDTLMQPGDKKIVLLNFPNNPTGYTCTEKEAAQIVETLVRAAEKGKKLVVIFDDAYFGLVYEPSIYRESLFGRVADCHDHILAVKVDGATKEDYAWGFRVGFITYGIRGLNERICTPLVDKTGGAIRGNISSASHVSQSLLLRAMASKAYSAEKEIKYRLLKSRYETVKSILAEHRDIYSRYFTALPNNSGYFMCIKLKGIDCEKLRRHLLEKHSIGVIACNDLIRIAYSSVSEQQIPLLFSKLYKACNEIQE
jgi:aspartate/methionine/tyrosine aminotransferase